MEKLKLVIPKGTIYENVVKLLNDAGIILHVDRRIYRPFVNDSELDIKIMKPQNIPKLVELGSHDAGFTGYDWVVETDADVVEVMDLKLDPVRIVAAIHEKLQVEELYRRKIVVASEYGHITRTYMDKEKFDYVFLQTYGATEVFPPDDADMIIDNTATGRTLKEQNLKEITTLLHSSTRFIANKEVMQNSQKLEKITELKTLFQAVIDAGERVLLEMNVAEDRFEEIIKILPCMRSPTIAPLYGKRGFAIKVAVKKIEVRKLIPKLKKLGATDILECEIRKVVV